MDAFTQDIVAPPAPALDCARCSRLALYRGGGAPVPSFGPLSARLLIVGMAPGVAGADRTGGRLFATLRRLGLAREEKARVALVDARITHAVRCAAPGDLPEPGEVKSCGVYLAGELGALPNLRAVLALGVLAHAAVLQACGIPPARTRFSHGAIHGLPDGLMLADAHQVSRYDGAGGRWTGEMFEAVVLGVLRRLEA